MVSDRIGLASEAALHRWQPLASPRMGHGFCRKVPFLRVHSRFRTLSAYVQVHLRLRFVVAIEITILIFCFLLTARYDREELDPKFLFVELN